jgi:hypothetical protein
MFGLRKSGECWVMVTGAINCGKFRSDFWCERCNKISEHISKIFCEPMLGRQEIGVCISINLKGLNCKCSFIV